MGQWVKQVTPSLPKPKQPSYEDRIQAAISGSPRVSIVHTGQLQLLKRFVLYSPFNWSHTVTGFFLRLQGRLC
ncbi:hypothetical protein PAXRUDRAFT_489088 [Paxillus rubicundulus Ve08.2h10]|uniref:Uncharacterized protein n=1 Tax=Paxillus rubicundulus Ve08.2h10 TaxID=930991 RepID=A0A0D0CWL7_9AGAM|nr:hypothetical protein PAXRUDRAFT_489088 [Paxillus rubicundulus Ve08.2h10]